MPATVDLSHLPNVTACPPEYSYESTLFVSARCYSDDWVYAGYTAWTVLFGIMSIATTAVAVRSFLRRQISTVMVCGVICAVTMFFNSLGQVLHWSLWSPLITTMIGYGALGIATVTITYRWMKGIILTHVHPRSAQRSGARRPLISILLDVSYYSFIIIGPLPQAVCNFIAGSYGVQHEDFPETYNKLVAAGFGWLGLCALFTAIVLIVLFIMLDRLLRRAEKSMEELSPGSTTSGENIYVAIRRRVWSFCIIESFSLIFASSVAIALMVLTIQRDGDTPSFIYVHVYVLNPVVWLMSLLTLIIEFRYKPSKGRSSGSSGVASSDSTRPTSATGGSEHKLEPSPYLQNIDMKQLSPTVEVIEEVEEA